ncbi:unknown [Bacteroides sp. CAG:633]|nr:unknown [Bacteroides sp. CAG:633]
MKNQNFAHGTGLTLALNPVAHFERAQNQYNQSTGKVLQIARQRHTNSHTGRCQQSSKRGSLNAQLSDNSHYQQNCQQDTHHIPDKALYTWIYLPLYHDICNHPLQEGDQKTSHYENDNCTDQVLTGIDAPVVHLFRKHLQTAQFICSFFSSRRCR